MRETTRGKGMRIRPKGWVFPAARAPPGAPRTEIICETVCQVGRRVINLIRPTHDLRAGKPIVLAGTAWRRTVILLLSCIVYSSSESPVDVFLTSVTCRLFHPPSRVIIVGGITHTRRSNGRTRQLEFTRDTINTVHVQCFVFTLFWFKKNSSSSRER